MRVHKAHSQKITNPGGTWKIESRGGRRFLQEIDLGGIHMISSTFAFAASGIASSGPGARPGEQFAATIAKLPFESVLFRQG
jgi:hypothetical protein